MKKRPNVTVKIMLRYKDKVLIVEHKDGNFGFPGGHVEWNESLIGALKRELKEELNYNLKKNLSYSTFGIMFQKKREAI